MIVEGQRVRWDEHTQLKIGRFSSLDDIPLGYEITVKGSRAYDGSFLAKEFAAKPNGIAVTNNEAKSYFGALEDAYLDRGAMFSDGPNGPEVVGRIITSGPEVDRLNRIMARLVPRYIRRLLTRSRCPDGTVECHGNGQRRRVGL